MNRYRTKFPIFFFSLSVCPFCLKAGPRITPFAMPPVSLVNSRVQVSCVVDEGDPPFNIRWYRDGLVILPGRPGQVTGSVRLTDFNAYSSILTIDQVFLIVLAGCWPCPAKKSGPSKFSFFLPKNEVTVNHGGNYSCRAENAAGTAVHSAFLRVSGNCPSFVLFA